MRATHGAERIHAPLRSGLLLRRRLFGEEAVYRVLQTRGEIVKVEVVTAVGLPPGTQLKLTVATATEMRATPVTPRSRPQQEVRAPARRELPAIPRS